MIARLAALVRGEHGQQKGRAARNTVWLVAERVVRLAITVVTLAWVARYLGPARLGQLNYALAYVIVFFSLSSLGLKSVVVRELVASPDKEPEILGSSIVLRLTACAVAAILAAGTSTVLTSPDHGRVTDATLICIVAAGAVFQAFDVIDYYFQSKVRSRVPVVVRTVALSVTAAVKLGLVWWSADLVWFAVAVAAEWVLASVLLVVVAATKGTPLWRWRARRREMRALLKSSWPLAISGVIVMLYMRVDQLMIGAMAGKADVGFYSIAVQFSEFWFFVPTAICASVTPALVASHARDPAAFDAQIDRLYRLMVCIALAAGIVTTLAARPMVLVTAGADYVPSISMLMALVWSGLFVSLGIARGTHWVILDWNQRSLLTTLIGLIGNIALNLLLIPRYGAWGAVIATIIAYWLAAHGSCYLIPGARKTGDRILAAIVWPKFW